MANAKTIFIIKGAEGLLGNDHNLEFISTETYANEDADAACQHADSVYEDHDTPAPVFSPPLVLRITTDHVPKDKLLGFVVGRNSDKCDILLDDARVSETHFALQLHLQSGAILLHNYSKHGTWVTFSKQNESKALRGAQPLLEFETADINLGDNIYIQIRRYGEPVDWKQYYTGLAMDTNAPLRG